jgi:hypothetical protein
MNWELPPADAFLDNNATTSVFFSAFVKSRQAAISFVTYVRLSAWKTTVHTGMIFIKFDI